MIQAQILNRHISYPNPPLPLPFFPPSSPMILAYPTNDSLYIQLTLSPKTLQQILTHMLPILPTGVLARDHISNLPAIQKYKCAVCFDVQPNIMRCSGPCKANLCLTCASTIVITSNQVKCPQRCCPQLVLEPIPHMEVQFTCPYDKENCQTIIEGKYAFAEHLQTCPFITAEAVNEQMKSMEHVCHFDHPLLFLEKEITQAFFRKIVGTSYMLECAGCGDKKACRSYCRECSTEEKQIFFCHDCRALPFTRYLCPNATHVLQIRETRPRNICDMCSQAIYLISELCYSDPDCDVCVCMECYEKLPEVHHLVPLETNRAYRLQFQEPEPPEEQPQQQQQNEEPLQQNVEPLQAVPNQVEPLLQAEGHIESEESEESEEQEQQEEIEVPAAGNNQNQNQVQE